MKCISIKQHRFYVEYLPRNVKSFTKTVGLTELLDYKIYNWSRLLDFFFFFYIKLFQQRNSG